MVEERRVGDRSWREKNSPTEASFHGEVLIGGKVAHHLHTHSRAAGGDAAMGGRDGRSTHRPGAVADHLRGSHVRRLRRP